MIIHCQHGVCPSPSPKLSKVRGSEAFLIMVLEKLIATKSFEK